MCKRGGEKGGGGKVGCLETFPYKEKQVLELLATKYRSNYRFFRLDTELSCFSSSGIFQNTFIKDNLNNPFSSFLPYSERGRGVGGIFQKICFVSVTTKHFAFIFHCGCCVFKCIYNYTIQYALIRCFVRQFL